MCNKAKPMKRIPLILFINCLLFGLKVVAQNQYINVQTPSGTIKEQVYTAPSLGDNRGTTWDAHDNRQSNTSSNTNNTTTTSTGTSGTSSSHEWEMKNNKPSGDGTGAFYFANGEKYVGIWKDWEPCDYGKLYDANGNFIKDGYWWDGEYVGAPPAEGRFAIGKSVFTGTWQDHKLTGHGTIQLEGDDVFKYEGDIVDHEPSGNGTMTEEGDTRSGTWTDGYLNGPDCKVIYTAGDRYEGGYVMGAKAGEGTYTYKSGKIESGTWVKGEMTGSNCKIFYTDSSSYIGDVVNDKLEGRGTYTWHNGDKLTCQFMTDRANGPGVETLINGKILTGPFTDWQLSGNDCEIIYSDGGKYTGDVILGFREGYGILIYPNGDKYEGHFKHDAFSGTVTLTTKTGKVTSGVYKNGLIKPDSTIVNINDSNKYEGDLVNGLRQGKGTCTYRNGNVYVGQWKGDRFDGYGVLTFKSGEVLTGSWIDGFLTGYNCEGSWPDGSSYKGNMVNGFHHGLGAIILANGNKYTGHFNSDKMDGYGVFTYKDGTVCTGDWEGGLNGKDITIKYTDGGLYEGSIVNGLREGWGTYTWPTGKKYEGNWKGGNQVK